MYYIRSWCPKEHSPANTIPQNTTNYQSLGFPAANVGDSKVRDAKKAPQDEKLLGLMK